MSEHRTKVLELHELLSQYDPSKIRSLLIQAAERVMNATNCFAFADLLAVSKGNVSGTVTDAEMGERHRRGYNIYASGLNDFSRCQCDPSAKFPNNHYACFCAAWASLMSSKSFAILGNLSQFAFPVMLFYEHYKAVLDEAETGYGMGYGNTE